MALYVITHKCGHIAIYQIYGPSITRGRRVNILKSTSCNWCLEKAKEKDKHERDKNKN